MSAAPIRHDGLVGRLLAFDLDGTLLDGSSRLAERTMAAIQAASDAGAVCAVATGRDWSGVIETMELAQGLDYAVCVNGTEVWHRDGSELHAVEIGVDVARAAIDAIRAAVPDVSIAAGLDGELVGEAALIGVMNPDFGRLRHCDDLSGELRSGVRDLLLWHPTLCEDLTAFHQLCSEALIHVDVDVAHGGLPMIELIPRGWGKGTGLAWLARHVGIDQRHVIAFGDGMNDLSMLTWAGHGVAMGQSAAAVLAVADEVALSHTDHGVAAWIEGNLSEPTRSSAPA